MPENATRTLMTVHAHPDDETISTGGVMAKYARAGDRVICVTCTGGERGEIVVKDMDTPENHDRLAEIRAEELRRALEILGPIEHHFLGYVDSGMMGTPENDDPQSFWQADLDEAAGRLVRLVRQERPEVIVGYNDFGGYGHPDHIRAAQVAKLAFERAGDPGWYPEQLEANGLTPWPPREALRERHGPGPARGARQAHEGARHPELAARTGRRDGRGARRARGAPEAHGRRSRSQDHPRRRAR